jgi:two-component system, NarL family, sensor histidine kinase UhpB
MASKLDKKLNPAENPRTIQLRKSESPTRRKALAWQCAELRAIYDHAPILLCTVDKGRHVLYANRAFCKFTGIAEKQLLKGRACGVFGCINALEDSRGCGFGKKCPECGLRRAMDDTLRTGHSHKNVEYRATLERDGIQRQVIMLGSTVRVLAGGDYRLLLCLQDVTEQKHAEQALRESEKRMRTVVEDQTEVISRINPDGTLAFVNEVCCRYFGKKIEQLMGKRWRPMIVAEDLPLVEKRMSQISPANPVVVIENRVYSGTGEIRWMQFVNRGFFNSEGHIIQIQSVGRDITERKQAEQSYRESEAQLRAIIEHSMAGILLTSPDGRIFAANPAACTFLRRTEKEIIKAGRDNLIDLRDSRTRALLKERRKKGHAVGEIGFVRADGTTFPTQVASALFETAAGLRTSLVFLDISERKLAEEQIHNFSRKLLSVREEEKRLISSALHHEVGSITVGIMARLIAAEDELRKGNRRDSLKSLGECRRVFRNAATSLKKLAVELRPPDLDILGLRASLRHYFTRITRETHLKVSFTDATTGRTIPPEIQIFLFRAVQECLTNVLKHADADHVRVRMSADGQLLRLSIIDNGKGFDPETAAVRQTEHLGLRAIQEMAASLGGRMDIASNPGRGAKFCMTVPTRYKKLQTKTHRSNFSKTKGVP